MAVIRLCVVAFVLTTSGGGCDQKESATATAAPAPPPTPADPYLVYAQTMHPLIDELQRMRILLDRPATVEAADFNRQMREVKLRRAQVEPKLTPEDRAHASWQRVSKAMERLGKLEQGFERKADLASVAENMAADAARPKPPPTLDDVPKLNAETRQTLSYMTEALLLQNEMPKAMAAAGGEILLAEADLREKR